jgi:Ca2+-binding EF-hand superfamily protein
LKRDVQSTYNYSIAKLFKFIDDWSYNYLDHNNIKRFLKTTGYRPNKQVIESIVRRFDIDGDAKINFEEFQKGL